jgi:3-oxoacyl-[acyl-carrier-protein] synthase III
LSLATEGFGIDRLIDEGRWIGQKTPIHQVAGGSMLSCIFGTQWKIGQHLHLHQEGQPVFKAAVSHMADTAVEMMQQKQYIQPENLAWLSAASSQHAYN